MVNPFYRFISIYKLLSERELYSQRTSGHLGEIDVLSSFFRCALR